MKGRKSERVKGKKCGTSRKRGGGVREETGGEGKKVRYEAMS